MDDPVPPVFTRPDTDERGQPVLSADATVDEVDWLLDEVEAALARLDDGTYGRCERCGAELDDTALADQPMVRACGRCRSEEPGAEDGREGAAAEGAGVAGHRTEPTAEPSLGPPASPWAVRAFPDS